MLDEKALEGLGYRSDLIRKDVVMGPFARPMSKELRGELMRQIANRMHEAFIDAERIPGPKVEIQIHLRLERET